MEVMSGSEEVKGLGFRVTGNTRAQNCSCYSFSRVSLHGEPVGLVGPGIMWCGPHDQATCRVVQILNPELLISLHIPLDPSTSLCTLTYPYSSPYMYICIYTYPYLPITAVKDASKP